MGALSPAAAQTIAPTIARIDAGSLNHGDLFRIQLTLGATIGWQVSPRGTVSLRYLRQSQTAEGEDDAALLPTEDAVICDRFGFCARRHFDGHLEHNLGFFISGEWGR